MTERREEEDPSAADGALKSGKHERQAAAWRRTKTDNGVIGSSEV